MSTPRLTLKALALRLELLEAEQAVRRCMNRYMTICDALGVETSMDELASLFTRDAVWEGVGDKYRATFGRLEGRAAIRAMLAKYTVAPQHFQLNAHFLCSEEITVTGEAKAVGRWLMLQTSTYSSGASHLSGARLEVDFRQSAEGWQIHHFRTENLMGRPVKAWRDEKSMPVPR